MAYHGLNEYDCVADYYDAGNLGSRSPASIRRQRAWESRNRVDDARRISESMRRHQELYGD